MVTGRSVSRSIRDWVGVRSYSRLQDHQRLQTSTLATHSNDHLDVSTSQSVRWRLQLPARQLGLQYNIPGLWEPGLLGRHPTTLDCCTTQRKQPLSSLAVGTSAPTQTWPSRVSARTANSPDRRVLGKIQRSQHRPSLITPPRFKVPAHSDPVKRWNFRKADWKRFCFLTGESVERLPPPDTTDIERAYQDFARAYFLWLNNVSHVAVGRTMCHAGTKSARPSIAPLSAPQWGLTLTEPPRPYSLDYNRRNRTDGRKLSTPSSSRTPSAKHGEQSTNSLAGLDAPLPCAPSRPNSIASQLVKNGAHKTGGCKSIRLVNKQLSDLWKIPAPEGHSISEPYRLEELAAALGRLKPGKSPGLDSIFTEFILHIGSALKFWFCDFLTSCMRLLKIPKIWRRALVVAIPKPEKPLEDPKDSSTLVSKQSSTHCSNGSRRASDMGGRP